MALKGDKVRSLLDSYNIQQRECGDLQVQIEQKETEIFMRVKQIGAAKRVIDDDLKPEIARHQREETKFLENLRNLEKEIKLEKLDKNESYLKIVAAEESIRNLRESARRNMRRNIQEMEKCAFDAFKRRTAMRDLIGVALVPGDGKDDVSPDITSKALNMQL